MYSSQKELESIVESLLMDPLDFKRITRSSLNGINRFVLIKEHLTIEGIFLIIRDRIKVSNIKVIK